MTFSPLFERTRFLLTLGPGGVGKTTTAAALALKAACAGHRTLVCTIDPARRLASSLGVTVGDEPTQVDPALLAAMGCPQGIHLSAMMLDASTALDRLLLTGEPGKERSDLAVRLREHPLYQAMVRDLPGMHEYASISRLYELSRQGEWDLVVLDTPPTTHALDFLDSPRRLVRALESPAVQWLVRPYLRAGRLSFTLMGGARAYVLRRLAQIVGTGLLERIAEFLVLFEGIVDGVRERTEAVSQLLASEQVGYVIVTSPTPASVREAAVLAEQLVRRRLSVDGLILNRVHALATFPMVAPQEIAEALSVLPQVQSLAAEAQMGLLKELAVTHQRFQRLAQGDQNQLERLLEKLPRKPLVATVPLMAEDIHDLSGLRLVAGHL